MNTMRSMMVGATLAVACCANAAVAQSASAHIALGDRAYAAQHPAAALAEYKLAIAAQPSNVSALWKASNAAVAVGEFPSVANGSDTVAVRATYYKQAEEYARNAVSVDSASAKAQFALAQALGRVALTIDLPIGRVPYSRKVYRHATACLALDPASASCAHVLGVWNAEVMRVPDDQRDMAIHILGAFELSKASWENAKRYLERSMKAEPAVTLHHVDLAGVLRDMGDTVGARAQLAAALATPGTGVNEAHYKIQAQSMLSALTTRRPTTSAMR